MCVFQGRITVTGQLDREKGDTYTLTVVADDGGPKKDSTVVRLTLTHGFLHLSIFKNTFITVYFVSALL